MAHGARVFLNPGFDGLVGLAGDDDQMRGVVPMVLSVLGEVAEVLLYLADAAVVGFAELEFEADQLVLAWTGGQKVHAASAVEGHLSLERSEAQLAEPLEQVLVGDDELLQGRLVSKQATC